MSNKEIVRMVTPEETSVSLGIESSYMSYDEIYSDQEYKNNDYQIIMKTIFIETLTEDYCIKNNVQIRVSLTLFDSKKDHDEECLAYNDYFNITDYSSNYILLPQKSIIGIFDYLENGISGGEFIDLSNFEKIYFSILKNKNNREIKVFAYGVIR